MNNRMILVLDRMILPVRTWIGPHANGWPQRISNVATVSGKLFGHRHSRFGFLQSLTQSAKVAALGEE